MNGYWNMKDKKVIIGAKISNWPCVNFCADLSKKTIEEFCIKLAERSRITGVDFANLMLPIFTARSDQVGHDIRMRYQEAQNKLRGNIRRICQTDIGLVSRCCRRSNVCTKSNQILASMTIKINAKITPVEFTEMALEETFGAVDTARLAEQQIMESEHLMKALLDQKDGLARRIFSKAGINNTSVLQATDDFISRHPKVLVVNLNNFIAYSITRVQGRTPCTIVLLLRTL